MCCVHDWNFLAGTDSALFLCFCIRRFGSSILQPDSEEIDRKKLGSIVFADRSAMVVSPRMCCRLACSINIDGVPYGKPLDRDLETRTARLATCKENAKRSH